MNAVGFGGDDKKPWEFRFGWDHGITKSEAAPGGVDRNGIYQPETVEVDSELGFPDVNAGLAGEVYPKAKITPTVQFTTCEFKVPYARWFDVQIGAGANLVDVYLGKRLVTLPKITVGPWFGRDLDVHKWSGGIQFTLIKF